MEIDLTPDSYPDEPAPRFNALDWHSLWDSADEAEDWLVEPLIGRGRLVSLYSAPGVGKSLLALEIAAALASGGAALGNSYRPTSVVYVDHENDPRGDVVSRLRAMGYSPRHLERLAYYSFPAMATLDTSRGGEELLELAQSHRAELVIIDTVSRTVQGEENENGTWLDLYRHTCRQLKAEGIACLRLDHAGKDLAKGQRGGSAKTGDVDMVWLLTRQSTDVFRLNCEKSRQHMPEEEQVLTLRRLPEPLRHELAANPHRAAQQARISALVAHLDALNVPRDAGRPTAGQALRDAAIRHTTADLGKALKQRRELFAPILEQVTEQAPDELPEQETNRTER